MCSRRMARTLCGRPRAARKSLELDQMGDVRPINGRVGPAAGPQMAPIRGDGLIDRVAGLARGSCQGMMDSGVGPWYLGLSV